MSHMPTWIEADRLAALRRYDILDTADDPAFQDFVQIAAVVCQAPIAVVNLIDEARQWFAAEMGLGVRETPLDISICARAILQEEVFVVPDLAKDPAFACNPLVTGEPKLRFYGGALLRTAEGLPLGTMCVLDYQPRPQGLTEVQVSTLQALARQVMAQLELRRALALQARSEAEKDRLLQEKDLLMGEVHHRVKNSLSMVQSLLTLQARALGDGVAAQQLTEGAARIRTVGAMHEQLYRFGAATDVNVADYLRGLLDEQQSSMAGESGRRILFEGTDADWPAHDVPTLGLVAVELVTNALKYGAGTVLVRLGVAGDTATLLVQDEGRGLPPDFDPAATKGFGMRLVSGLLQSRRGRLALDRSQPGTSFVATFHRPDPLPTV